MSPADLAPAPPPRRADERLRRVLSDLPVTVGRSGLTVLLKASPGMANALGQAIDESSLDDQEGTLAGDDTLLVLFADEPRLERWLDRFAALAASVRRHPALGHPRVRRTAPHPHGGLLMNKVVLAYSGGLDTSVAVAWLKERYGAEVITLTVDRRRRVAAGKAWSGVRCPPARPARTSSMPASGS